MEKVIWISSKLARFRARREKLKADLRKVNSTIALLERVELEVWRPRRPRQRMYPRVVMEYFRAANGPVTSGALVSAIRSAYEGDERVADLEHVRKLVRKTLVRYRVAGVIREIGMDGEYKVWELVRDHPKLLSRD